MDLRMYVDRTTLFFLKKIIIFLLYHPSIVIYKATGLHRNVEVVRLKKKHSSMLIKRKGGVVKKSLV